MRRADTGDLWWKNAVFYCADIETFYDSNGDGTGDIRGMTDRIEYLTDLGVTCLWLMPFYPTARKDDGYDITDFFGVDPRLGTLGDFVELVRTARSNGIRVIVDFVMNHTSDAHPWFKSARRSTDDPYRDYYVWSATEPKSSAEGRRLPRSGGQHLGARPQDQRVVPAPLLQAPARPQHRESRSAGRDLTHARLLARARRLRLPGRRRPLPVRQGRRAGQARRVRPASNTSATSGTSSPAASGTQSCSARSTWPTRTRRRSSAAPTATGSTCSSTSSGCRTSTSRLARGDARPIAKALRQRPTLDITSQWANFVRNHDELTLDKLSDSERQEVFDAFGPDPDMQLYGRGLRRRLPSMLGGDERRMKMAYSLAFSLPGTPVLFYGEEIGMAENLDIPGRLAVRSPMQWTGGPNGGFSRATKRRLTRPLPDGLVRTGTRQRRRPTPRPRLLLVVHAQPHLHLPRNSRRPAGRTSRSSNSPTERCWPTCAGRNPGGRWLRCTTSGRTVASSRSNSRTCRRAPSSSTCSTASRKYALDAHGRVEIHLEPYGYRWLRVKRPEDEPIV